MAEKTEGAGGTLAKVAVLVALIAVAGWLGARRLGQARVDWLLGSLSKGDESALKALGEMGDRALPYLEREVRGPNADARIIAVLALGAIDTDAATKLIVECARDPDAITAANAISVLGSRRGPGAMAAVFDSLGDRRWRVQRVARHAAARRTGLPWWGFGLPRKAEGKG